MPETFADYVRSGRLQKNFDDAVKKAAEEAKQQGLRRPEKMTDVGTDEAAHGSTLDKTAAQSKRSQR
jgi:hypothetical protein